MKHPLILFACSFLLLSACSHMPQQQRKISQEINPVLYSWSQLIGNGEISFRAIVNTEFCPSIRLNNEEFKMQKRADLDTELHLMVCELRANQDTESANIENIELPVLTKQLNRVVAIGDSGCRMKKVSILKVIQECKDANKWPFEKISISAAAQKPDLTIHLGDYNYRDIDCPRNEEKCSGLAAKDNWKSWEQDVIRPMNSLLKISPFIFVRGNHENCEGGFGKGWFKLLSPDLYDSQDKCTEQTATYNVKINNINFVNIDSASESNLRSELTIFEKKSTNEYLWLLTHRPFLAVSEDVDLKNSPKFGESLKKVGAVQLVMAAHTHIGSFVSFKDNLTPPELIIGNSGVMLEFFTKGPVANETNAVNTIKEYGYALFSRLDEQNWQLLMFNKDSQIRINCKLEQKFDSQTQMNCANQ